MSGNERGKGRRRGKRRNAHFMDAVMDGYVRDVALHKWRELEDLREVYGGRPETVLREAGRFPEAGPYQPIWQRQWHLHIPPSADLADNALFGHVEAAVRDALIEERKERERLGDVTIDDTAGFKAFVARAMGQLLEEASGEIEDMDDE